MYHILHYVMKCTGWMNFVIEANSKTWIREKNELICKWGFVGRQPCHRILFTDYWHHISNDGHCRPSDSVKIVLVTNERIYITQRFVMKLVFLCYPCNNSNSSSIFIYTYGTYLTRECRNNAMGKVSHASQVHDDFHTGKETSFQVQRPVAATPPLNRNSPSSFPRTAFPSKWRNRSPRGSRAAVTAAIASLAIVFHGNRKRKSSPSRRIWPRRAAVALRRPAAAAAACIASLDGQRQLDPALWCTLCALQKNVHWFTVGSTPDLRTDGIARRPLLGQLIAHDIGFSAGLYCFHTPCRSITPSGSIRICKLLGG